MTVTIDIAVIIASTRQGRLAPTIAGWVVDQAARHPQLAIDVVDLDELDIPSRLPSDPVSVCEPWLTRLDAADAFVIVTPEYNHSFPAPLKQAIDLAGDEFRAKPVAFVTYGGVSGGVRAAEQLRPIFAEMRAATIREAVCLQFPWEHLDDAGAFVDPGGAADAAAAMFEELSWWADALNAARCPEQPADGHALFVTHRSRPGRRNDVVMVWDRHLRPLAEQNPDHLAYFYCLDDTDPDVVRVFQLYRDAAAADRFLQQPGYFEYLDQVLPLVAEPPRREVAAPVWIKRNTVACAGGSAA